MKPKIGDTVTVKVIVTSTHVSSFGASIYGQSVVFLDSDAIKIDPKPPRIGDTVWWVKSGRGLNPWCTSGGATLIYIHNTDARKFAVVAYKGDMPQSVWFDDLRGSWEECVA